VKPASVAVFDNYWATTLSFARSLGRKGVPLHFYGNGAGRWSRYRTSRHRCPTVENAAVFLPWLRDRVRSGEISRVAPTTDLIAYYCSVLREEFSPEVRRTIAPLSEIENCLIKTRFTGNLQGHPVLATAAPDSVSGAISAAKQIGYPLILKPKSHLGVGSDERGHLLRNEADLLQHYRRYSVAPGQESIAAAYPELRWPLLQRYVPSASKRVYSVTGIKDPDSGVLVPAVSYKREQWPPNVGVSTVQIAYEDDRILKAGLEVVNKLLSRGIFEVELLADEDDLYAIDLNPRGYGFLELDMARGADLPWLWYQSTLEILQPSAVPLPAVSLEARNRFRHLLNAVMRPRRAFAMDRRNPQKPRSSVSMVGHWSDPLPMLLSNLQLLRHPRSLLRSQVASLRAQRKQNLRVI
jgi:predicted ATP-grasp superfamily ATP-dependent carboligase